MSAIGSVVVITIMTSSVVAAVVTYFLNATKEHVFFMRQKAESLYLSVERHHRSLSSHYIIAYPVLKNEISYNEYLDLQNTNLIRTNKDSADALDMATMLINVYFSDLTIHLNGYAAARGNINEILSAHKLACKRGDTDGGRWFKQFHEAVNELDHTAKAFKQAILSEAVKLALAAQLWPRSLRLPALWLRVKTAHSKIKGA